MPDERPRSTVTPIPLGAFELLDRIGAGGMGVVYRARHRLTGAEVAVKVLRGEPDERAVRRFRREVQAHAGLVHPGIVQLLEYGDVDDAAVRASSGSLHVGSPFVGMELAAGTIRHHQVDTWPALREVIAQVLRALAHAHARGVIHRDLKPDNLLIFPDADGTSVKLTDFGIAHALSSISERGTKSLGSVIGTPKYMAPEQLLGRWRDHGPWTDLYALGCITFELLCGYPPYSRSGGGIREALAHLTLAPERLEPRFAVPTAVESWLQRAMAVDPGGRFQRANEAKADLPMAEEFAGPLVISSRPPAHIPTTEPLDTAPTLVLGEVEPKHPVPAATADQARRPAPPESWSTPTASPATLVGAGLGLFGLRQTPFVGRAAEREIVWDAFRRTASRSGVEAVLIEGQAGIGKSRLADWAATLALEIGSASVLSIGDFTRATEGLETALRTWMMSREDAYHHLLQTLPPLDGDVSRDYDARSLADLLRPTRPREGEAPSPMFTSPSERLAVLQRLIRRFAADRPTVVLFDDIQWAASALDLVQHLLDGRDPPSVLILATLRSDIVADRPALAERIERLAESPRVTRISLQPLTEAESRELARSLLVIPDSGAELLVRRMEGNPLFGVQLLTDWVERGLAPNEMDASSTFELPQNVHAVWLKRLRRLERQADDPDRFRFSVEVAAILGQSVSRMEWESVCQVEPNVSKEIWDRLTVSGLARQTHDGWRFAHGLLLESLLRLSREAGSAPELHAICANGLSSFYERERSPIAGRLAAHWIQAGQPRLALEPLREEAERLRQLDDHLASLELLTRRAEIFDELGVPDDDPVRADNQLEILTDQTRLGGNPREILEACMLIIARLGDRAPGVACKAWRAAAISHESMGEYRESDRCITIAVDLARQSGNQREWVTSSLRAARIETWHGNRETMRERLAGLRAHARERSDAYLEVRVEQLLAWGLIIDDPPTAEEAFHRALDLSRQLGARSLLADCHNGLGDLARVSGDHGRACEYYREASRLYREMDQPDAAAVVGINWALAEIVTGQLASAEVRLMEARATLDGIGVTLFTSLIEVGVLLLTATRRDWPGFDRALEFLTTHLEDAGRMSHDDIWGARVASSLAAAAGETERAALAAEHSRRCHEFLTREGN